MFLHLQVIFLIGNKSDLEAQRDVTYEEAKQFADENGGYYYCYQPNKYTESRSFSKLHAFGIQ